ncbi:hypothetical protein C7T35_01565 [Variovorax sp. WS11]|uniref:hypothetical protein n=1 Tax=Variovorax sp. WS11 TaxID=1105204 RepID=UPI000D0DD84F|nr:hypothetical protein [Variovorax sp. WS11]NDZ15307.1 hypothetical protein [Variovorax sp. WS11]PSL86161.1 hypothetical protein C7T35_01565 [Variovorax sp. WS11]
MEIGLAQWQFLLALLTGALLLFVVMWIAWHRVSERREAERRIAAARVRSGHVPLEIPTVRGGLTHAGDSVPDTLPEWFIQGKGEHSIVDEQPRIRVRFVDPHGRKAECTMQVEHLDLQKKILTGHSELPGDTYRIPLHMITGARIAESGQRFNIDTWVDAVRVARRRRGQI